MHRHLPGPLAAIALACLAALFAAAPAAATRPADLRVVADTGQSLTDIRQYSGGARVPTDPGADCFGPGSGGSGDPLVLDGATALGAVDYAAETDTDLVPLSISDAFDFGPAVCGIGGHEAPATGYWYLKVDHAGSTVGGAHPLDPGDDVLWYLVADFNEPTPRELILRAPARAEAGEPFVVEVLAASDGGTVRAARNANVTGALAPTNERGRTRITALDDVTLRATRSGDIPSRALRVCVAADLGDCPARRGRTIVGSERPERIEGTAGPDQIRARSGNDVVDVAGGAADSVSCGPGASDKAIVSGHDQTIGCEEVVRA